MEWIGKGPSPPSLTPGICAETDELKVTGEDKRLYRFLLPVRNRQLKYRIYGFVTDKEEHPEKNNFRLSAIYSLYSSVKKTKNR
jgi:hypothetical protein